MMHRVLVNTMQSDWAVHFIGPDGQTRIGPWLLLDTAEEVRAVRPYAGKMQIHTAHPKVGNVRNDSLAMLDSQ